MGNIKPSNIPNRLRNVSAEHPYVAGAVDIIDDSLNRNQQSINADVDSTLVLHQSEINALDSQNYVTVDTYAELPELGSVDTIYRVGSWDGTQVDPTKYAEYAWKNTGIDQGEYVLLDVKNPGIDDEPTAGSDNLVKSGGVYNSITEHNPYNNVSFVTNFESFWIHRAGGTVELYSPYTDLNSVEKIKVSPSSKWNISCSRYGTAYSYYIVDEDFNLLNGSDTDTFSGEVTIPNNGAYLLLNYRRNGSFYAIEEGSVIDKINKAGSNIASNTAYIESVNLFSEYDKTNPAKIKAAHSFIKDIELGCTDPDYLNDCYLLYILKNVTIGGDVYHSINVRFVNSENNRVDCIFNLSETDYSGIKYYEKNSTSFFLKVLVDWDAIEDGNYSFGYRFKDYYTESHPGFIDDIKSERQNTDQMFIYNNEVVCFNNYRNSQNVYARYAKVDLGNTAKIFKCRFKMSGGTLCLATMPSNTDNPVNDITVGSVHITLEKTRVQYGVYKNWVWNPQTINLSPNLEDGVVYEFGFEFMGNNVLKFYLPDNTEVETEPIEDLDSYNGRYIIFEQYGVNTYNYQTIDFPRVTYLGVYAKPVSGLCFHDNFLRANGGLTVAPSGHIYRVFRNEISGSDSIYDY